MRTLFIIASLLLSIDAHAQQKLLISNTETAQRYLQGYDVSESAVVIIHVNEHSFTSDFNTYLSAIAKRSVTAHISEPDGLMYEWESESGTRIFSGTPPHWYGNPSYPRDEVKQTKVYGNFGVLLDDSATAESTEFQKQLRRQERLFQKAETKITQRRDELQAKINSGKIEEGMSEFEVLAIWGEPFQKAEVGNVITYIYKNGWMLYFTDGIVSSTKFDPLLVR